MTDVEIKSLKTQLTLCESIMDADKMIIYTIQDTTKAIFEKIIKPKIYRKDNDAIVEFTIEEFNELRVQLTNLISDEGLKELNSWIDKRYISPKQENKKILSMLK